MVAHSTRSLQDHLYVSFLEGSTADVALHISGSWSAVYKLHRVILIQAVGLFPHLISVAALNWGTTATGILPTPLYRRFLGIAFPPETIALQRS